MLNTEYLVYLYMYTHISWLC